MNNEIDKKDELVENQWDSSSFLDAQLESIPIVSPIAEVDDIDEHRARITAPRKFKWWSRPLKRIFKLTDQRKVELDPVGTEVFRLFDGQRNLEEVVDIVKEKYNLSFFEGRALVLSFLQELMKRNLMFVRPSPALVGEGENRRDEKP